MDSEGFEPPKAEPADLHSDLFGRAGCQVPLSWQAGVAGSTVELYKPALKVRSDLHLGEGSFDWALEFIGENSLRFRNGDY